MMCSDAAAAGAGTCEHKPTLNCLPAQEAWQLLQPTLHLPASSCPSSHSSQLCLTPGHCWRILLGIPSTATDTKSGGLGELTCVTMSVPADLVRSPHSPTNTAQLLERSHFTSPRKAEGNGISPPVLGEIPLSCRPFFTPLAGKCWSKCKLLACGSWAWLYQLPVKALPALLFSPCLSTRRETESKR